MHKNHILAADSLKLKPRSVAAICILTLLLALPRFAHHTPDSQFYLDLASYFRGDLGQAQLAAPYAYRVLLPWLASIVPWDDLEFIMASLNVLFIMAAYVVAFFFFRELLRSPAEVYVALLLLVVSFPTVNYASGVLTDPLGFLLFLSGTFALLKERFLTFTIIVSLGVLTRESTSVLVVAAVLYMLLTRLDKRRKDWWLVMGAVIIIPILAFLAPRYYFADLAPYYWVPSFERVYKNLVRPVSWATLLLAAAIPMILLLVGIRQSGLTFLSDIAPRKRLIIILVTLTGTLLVLYSVLSAFMGGRFFWPLYVTLIPMGVLAIRETRLFQRWLAPLALAVFGQDDVAS